MKKLSYKIMFVVTTFILGVSVVKLWKSDYSAPTTVSSASPNFTLPEKIERSENQEILPPLEMKELKINNVELGSSYSTVVSQLGKPLKDKKGGFDNCAYGYRRAVSYSGLIIALTSDERERNYTVSAIEVNSPKWSVSGINIGADIKEVKDRFRNSYSERKEADLDALFYGNGDGWIVFYFKNNKLVKISWKYNFC